MEEENSTPIETGISDETFRIKVTNLPVYMNHPQFKKLLNSKLSKIAVRKVKIGSGVAYFTTTSFEDGPKAIELLNNCVHRGKSLLAKRTVEMEHRPATEKDVVEYKSKTANEISAPLSNLSYDNQIRTKFEGAKKTMDLMIKQLAAANVHNSRYISTESLLEPIVRSPVLTNYRNKCEFTIGLDANSEPCIGFISGNMSKRTVVVVPVEDSVLVSQNMKKICSIFTQIVKDSGLDVFNEFERVGFWKRLVIRDFCGDCMIVVATHSFDASKLKEVQEKVLKTFIKFGDFTDPYEFNVTSVYWQTQDNISDPCVYDHIGGTPYIYETIGSVRFRISPYTFFQTNSRGCELLYAVIGDFIGVPSLTENEQEDQHKNRNFDPSKPIYLLDICCGAGTIGQYQMRRIERAIQSGKFSGNYACIGVELVEQAVQDARRNAIDNGFSEKKTKYISGDAAFIFRHVNEYFSIDPKDETSTICGILDPPRAGLSTKVISSCRKLEKMKRLIYVSCDPKNALKNLVDLCRPESKNYSGDPFKLEKIKPVDMFPGTNHLEWVILLTR